MAPQRKLEIVIAGDARGASAAMSDVSGKAGRMGSSMKAGFAVGAAAAAATVAAVGLVAKGLFDVGSSFDDAYDTIRIQTGATGSALGGLQDVFRGVVADVPTSFGDASTAIAGLNQRLDLTGPGLENVAEPLLNLTRLTGGDTATNVQSMSRLFGDWGVAAESMPDVLDEVFRASQQTGTGVDQLAQSAVQFGAPLRQMGFSLEESLALFGKFEAEGVNTSTVLAGMRRGLATFAQAGEAPAEALSRAVDSIKNAGSVAEANSTALEIFGSRAGPDMAAAIREGRFELDDLVSQIEGGSDTIAAASEDTADFGEKWTILKNRVLLALEPVATRVFDSVGNAMDTLGPKVEELVAWFRESIPPAVERVRTVFEEVWPKVRDAFLSAVEAVSSWWDDNGPAIMDTLSELGDTWKAAFDAVRLIVERVLGVISNLWDRFGRQWLGHVQTAFSAIVSVFRGVLQTIKGVLDLFVGIFTGDWSRAWEGVKQIFGGIWDAILGVLRLAVNAISGIIGAGMAVLSAAWGYAWRGIRAVMLGIWDGIKGAVRSSVDAVKRVVSGAWNAIRDTTSRVWNGIKGAITGALDGIKAGIRTAKSVIGDVWDRIKSLFRAPVSAVLRVVVNPFLGFLDDVADVVGLSVPHSFELPAFHSGGTVPGSGEVPALLLGGEGVLNREAMRELGPRGLEAMNRGEGIGTGPILAGGPTPASDGSLSQAALDAVLDGMNGLIGWISSEIPGDFLRRSFRATSRPLEAIRDFVGTEGPKKVVGSMLWGPGQIWEKLLAAVRTQFPGLPLISGLRPGAITATGNRSLHSLGRAIDIPPRMDVFDWLAQTWPGSGELIFSPAEGRQIYRGAPHVYGEPTRGDHWDHIHWGMFDQGGWLEPGLTLAYNGTGRPERVSTGAEDRGTHIHVHVEGPIIGSSPAEVERLLVAALERARRKGLVRT